MKKVVFVFGLSFFATAAWGQVSTWEYNNLVNEYNGMLSERNSIASEYDDLIDEYNDLVERANSTKDELSDEYNRVCGLKDKIANNLSTIMSQYYTQLPDRNSAFVTNVENFNYDSHVKMMAAFKSLMELSYDRYICNDDGVNNDVNNDRREHFDGKTKQIEKWIETMKEEKQKN